MFNRMRPSKQVSGAKVMLGPGLSFPNLMATEEVSHLPQAVSSARNRIR